MGHCGRVVGLVDEDCFADELIKMSRAHFQRQSARMTRVTKVAHAGRALARRQELEKQAIGVGGVAKFLGTAAKKVLPSATQQAAKGTGSAMKKLVRPPSVKPGPSLPVKRPTAPAAPTRPMARPAPAAKPMARTPQHPTAPPPPRQLQAQQRAPARTIPSAAPTAAPARPAAGAGKLQSYRADVNRTGLNVRGGPSTMTPDGYAAASGDKSVLTPKARALYAQSRYAQLAEAGGVPAAAKPAATMVDSAPAGAGRVSTPTATQAGPPSAIAQATGGASVNRLGIDPRRGMDPAQEHLRSSPNYNVSSKSTEAGKARLKEWQSKRRQAPFDEALGVQATPPPGGAGQVAAPGTTPAAGAPTAVDAAPAGAAAQPPPGRAGQVAPGAATTGPPTQPGAPPTQAAAAAAPPARAPAQPGPAHPSQATPPPDWAAPEFGQQQAAAAAQGAGPVERKPGILGRAWGGIKEIAGGATSGTGALAEGATRGQKARNLAGRLAAGAAGYAPDTAAAMGGSAALLGGSKLLGAVRQAIGKAGVNRAMAKQVRQGLKQLPATPVRSADVIADMGLGNIGAQGAQAAAQLGMSPRELHALDELGSIVSQGKSVSPKALKELERASGVSAREIEAFGGVDNALRQRAGGAGQLATGAGAGAANPALEAGAGVVDYETPTVASAGAGDTGGGGAAPARAGSLMWPAMKYGLPIAGGLAAYGAYSGMQGLAERNRTSQYQHGSTTAPLNYSPTAMFPT